MSHFTRVKTQITSQEHLITALRNLGHRVEANGRINGWGGQTRKVDLAVQMSNGRGIGFERDHAEAPFQVVADWMVTGVSEQDFTRSIEREYAAVGAEAGARKAGWKNIQRAVKPDGSIIITASKA